MSLTPLQRGWTSASPQGKKFAPPLEPNSASKCFLDLLLNEDSYEARCQFRQFSVKYDGFECVLLQHRLSVSVIKLSSIDETLNRGFLISQSVEMTFFRMHWNGKVRRSESIAKNAIF